MVDIKMESSTSSVRTSARIAKRISDERIRLEKGLEEAEKSNQNLLNQRLAQAFEAELDAKEINKLFEIIFEMDTGAVTEFLSREQRYFKTVCRRYSPYSMQQQLYLQQQREQERRRNFLTQFPTRYQGPENTFYLDTKNHLEKIMRTKVFRTKVVRNIISFIDNYSNKMIADEEDCNENCVICMCNFQKDQLLRKLHCTHRFHRKCIDEWLVKSYYCPVCRTSLTETGKVHRGLALLYNVWKQEKIELANAAAAAAASSNPEDAVQSTSKGITRKTTPESENDADDESEDDNDIDSHDSEDNKNNADEDDDEDDDDDDDDDEQDGCFRPYIPASSCIVLRRDF